VAGQVMLADEAINVIEAYVLLLEKNNENLVEALKVVLSQYKLFVGPDDEIAKTVIKLAQKALNENEK
jgi:hypothetical protein